MKDPSHLCELLVGKTVQIGYAGRSAGLGKSIVVKRGEAVNVVLVAGPIYCLSLEEQKPENFRAALAVISNEYAPMAEKADMDADHSGMSPLHYCFTRHRIQRITARRGGVGARAAKRRSRLPSSAAAYEPARYHCGSRTDPRQNRGRPLPGQRDRPLLAVDDQNLLRGRADEKR